MRQVLSLDAGWRFHLGDVASPVPNDSHVAAYMANKAGWARGAARGNFDDSDWRAVDLPHDWSVEGEFSPSNYLDNAFLPRGVGWYRRYFTLDPITDCRRAVWLQFEGVASHCTVYVNGHLLHRQFHGYTSFTVDVTDVARFGEDEPNVVAVRVDATPIEGWWYEGAGIYRHVWLCKSGPVRFEPYGVAVRTTPTVGERWRTTVEAAVRNDTDAPTEAALAVRLTDPTGVEVARASAPVAVAGRASGVAAVEVAVDRPALWSVESPSLYRAEVELSVAGRATDVERIAYGYRTVAFDADRGFLLNNRPVRLLGACNHQDHAGVGVAAPDSLHEFRIRRLKAMGCNAYRCAHHPPAPALLEACDRLGMLVIDENRTFGSSPGALANLASMVRRDRNHPSVIAWSICNEEAIQGTPVAARIGRAMQAHVRALDPTRPVTAAVSGGLANDDCLADAVEVVGINYLLHQHDDFRRKRPRTPVYSAETHCVLSTRGVYETDASTYRFGCYDEDLTPWGASARATWRHLRDRPHLAGLFVWTGFDYRGEPTPHGWPCTGAQFGQMDQCGFEKDAFWLHKAWFDAAGPAFVHVMPHWTWPGREGQPIRVRAIANCDAAELLLNGRSLGRKRVDPIEMAEWLVPYEPGVLAVVAYRSGGPAVEARVETTGPAAALGLEVHPTFTEMAATMPADGAFAIPVTVFAVDATGRRVPTASDRVSFAVSGPGRLIGVGNGDPTCHESDKGASRSLFNGLAQAIVQTTSAPGEITLAASAEGLAPATLRLVSTAVPPPPVAPVARPRQFLADWRMSPLTTDPPDPNRPALAQDVNSWERIDPARGPQQAFASTGGYATYRATLKPTRRAQERGGVLRFRSIVGEARVYFDGTPAAERPDGDGGPLDVPVGPGRASIAVTVIVRAPAGAAAGLAAAVELIPN